MHFSFEFDCPHFDGFVTPASVKRPEEIAIDSDDPNDRWFLVDQPEEETKSQHSGEKSNEQVVVVRVELKMADDKVVELQLKNKEEGQETAEENEDKTLNLPPTQHIFKKNNKVKYVRLNRNRIRNLKKIEQKQGASNPKDNVHTKRTNKSQICTRSKSGVEKRMHSKDRWPCPLPTKVQRDWEHQNKAKWYELSGESKKRALRSMRNMDYDGKVEQSRPHGKEEHSKYDERRFK